ncbi:putative S-adenosyl-L-methionine-dependent methyltransferase [Helianthus debilis subsp. tardiflorus]
MDMNAGLGSFAAALESPKSWVMNVMPTVSKKDTLGVIFERGLIGIYHDWCEAFSTYPRTYDLIHANGLLLHMVVFFFLFIRYVGGRIPFIVICKNQCN